MKFLRVLSASLGPIHMHWLLASGKVPSQKALASLLKGQPWATLCIATHWHMCSSKHPAPNVHFLLVWFLKDWHSHTLFCQTCPVPAAIPKLQFCWPLWHRENTILCNTGCEFLHWQCKWVRNRAALSTHLHNNVIQKCRKRNFRHWN